MLSDMLADLPAVAWEDGHEDWEALFRVVNSVCNLIEAIAKKEDISALNLPFGKASEPGLSFGPSQPNQLMRTQLAIARAGLLASQLGEISPTYRRHLESLQNSNFPIARFFAAKAMLAFEFNAGVGSGFFSAVVAFERAFNAIASLPDRQQAMQSDGGDTPPTEFKLNVDGLFSVFAAGAICSDNPESIIALWRDEALCNWGADSQVVAVLAGMSHGLLLPRQVASDVIHRRIETSIGEIFGAAMALLSDDALAPEELFRIQVLLSSATVCFPEGLILQMTFGRAMARRFAAVSKRVVFSPFLLASHRNNLQTLVESISEVEKGIGSIRALLTATAQVVGAELGELGTRLE
jgi:hypothetical protein